jgi:MobA/MobL family
MAIGFARANFVKRSQGKNACAKAAYNSRDKILFEETKFQEQKLYDWSHKEPVAYHKILLPIGAHPALANKYILWNKVEQKEIRGNSQTAVDFVFALPDDEILTFEDRREIAEKFNKKSPQQATGYFSTIYKKVSCLGSSFLFCLCSTL